MDEAVECTGEKGDQHSAGSARMPSAALYKHIDHIALAVTDIEQAVHLFGDILGFELKRRLRVEGARTGMLSAEFEANGIRFVICQGTEPESQVSRLVENFGVGLAHVAIGVDDVDEAVFMLQENGLKFDTSIIRGPGLTQAFSSRCNNTGLSFEFIARDGAEGFVDANIQELFNQLEGSDKF